MKIASPQYDILRIIDLPIENVPYQIGVWWNIDIVELSCKNVKMNQQGIKNLILYE